jgi:Fucose 4-O-acetylase and related acetyltransferases
MAAEISVSGRRLEWIDWMKVLGIYLIVLGHFHSIGERFIYVFHVPLFFVISGLLCKMEKDGHLFWKKLWYNLAIPMLIMAALNFMFYCVLKFIYGTFEPIIIYWFIRNAIFAMVSSFDNLWFVYTLILLKIIFQYCSSRKFFYSLIIVMLAIAFLYNTLDFSGFPFFLNNPNCVINVCIAFPFFALGLFISDYKYRLNELSHKMKLVLISLCGLLLVSVCWFYNGTVGMHQCNYGGNMLLFLLGGVSGSIMIFAVSKLLGHTSKMVAIISRGTIIILGFHKLFIGLIGAFFPLSYLDIIFAALIVVLFVPLIIIIEKHFPLMAGKYRINKN